MVLSISGVFLPSRGIPGVPRLYYMKRRVPIAQNSSRDVLFTRMIFIAVIYDIIIPHWYYWTIFCQLSSSHLASTLIRDCHITCLGGYSGTIKLKPRIDCVLKGNEYTWWIFRHFYGRKTTFLASCWLSYKLSPFLKQVYSKNKNLFFLRVHSFPLEQIPSEQGSQIILTELPPMHVCSFPRRGMHMHGWFCRLFRRTLFLLWIEERKKIEAYRPNI